MRLQLGPRVGLQRQVVERPIVYLPPKIVAAVHRHQLGDQSAHAVSDEDHVIQCGVLVLRVEVVAELLRSRRRSAAVAM